MHLSYISGKDVLIAASTCSSNTMKRVGRCGLGIRWLGGVAETQMRIAERDVRFLGAMRACHISATAAASACLIADAVGPLLHRTATAQQVRVSQRPSSYRLVPWHMWHLPLGEALQRQFFLVS